jgi:hypothetical protein
MFAPADHLKGCLFANDTRMPCQCGWHERHRKYHDAVNAARTLSAALSTEPRE